MLNVVDLEALVTSAMRGAGKTVNFAVIYGQTPFGLSQQLNVPQQQAKKYIEQYFQKYAGVKTYRDRILEEARAKKEVRTLMGRRRFVPDDGGEPFGVVIEVDVHGKVVEQSAAEAVTLQPVPQYRHDRARHPEPVHEDDPRTVFRSAEVDPVHGPVEVRVVAGAAEVRHSRHTNQYVAWGY